MSVNAKPLINVGDIFKDINTGTKTQPIRLRGIITSLMLDDDEFGEDINFRITLTDTTDSISLAFTSDSDTSYSDLFRGAEYIVDADVNEFGVMYNPKLKRISMDPPLENYSREFLTNNPFINISPFPSISPLKIQLKEERNSNLVKIGIGIFIIALIWWYLGGNSDASAVCHDGWTSHSQNDSGTCSDHGGVSNWIHNINN